MPPDAEPPRAHRTLDKSRMESFSDSVFGFAATLLAVNLAIHPRGRPLQHLLHVHANDTCHRHLCVQHQSHDRDAAHAVVGHVIGGFASTRNSASATA
jgi:hypothetical protein